MTATSQTIALWQPETVRLLRRICGNAAVLTDPAALIAYENDGLAFHRHLPDCVVIPRNADELKQIINIIREKDFPYVIRGAGTSLSGGPVAVAGGLVIHLSRLNSILEVNVDDQYCVVESGVVLNTLNAELKSCGLFYPPDPSSGFSCTLGGNVAENAGGLRCFRYGVTANYVLGIEFITTAGDLVQVGGPAGGLGISHAADWRALLIGSEGIFGTFTRLWLRLKPLPEKHWTFLATFRDLDAISSAIVELVRHPATPVAIELVDNNMVQLIEASHVALGIDKNSWVLLVEIDGPAALVDRQAVDIEALLKRHAPLSCAVNSDTAERLKMWTARKVGGGLMGQISPDLMIQDMVIPRSRLSHILKFLNREAEAVGLHVFNFFHAGDGNLHPNFLFDASKPGEYERVKALGKRLIEEVLKQGGMLSGEHGIGSDKREYIEMFLGERELTLHDMLVGLFNPDDQLNPEKVLPGRVFSPNKSDAISGAAE